jgi:hypothetical protein
VETDSAKIDTPRIIMTRSVLSLPLCIRFMLTTLASVVCSGALSENLSSFGSALTLAGGSAVLSNVRVEGNSGGSRGGAIWISSPGGLVMRGGSLTYNVARDRGAALEAECSRPCKSD